MSHGGDVQIRRHDRMTVSLFDLLLGRQPVWVADQIAKNVEIVIASSPATSHAQPDLTAFHCPSHKSRNQTSLAGLLIGQVGYVFGATGQA